jgi:hypothetical protein
MDFPASLPARLFGRVFVCPFGKSLPLLRKAKPWRFGFDVPSSASESQALFHYFAVFGRQFWNHGGEEDASRVTATP